MVEKQELLTIKEICNLLAVDGSTVRRWCRQNRFPNAFRIRLGRSYIYRIPKRDVDAIIEPIPQELETPERKIEELPTLKKLGLI